jgi:hypothetical protein
MQAVRIYGYGDRSVLSFADMPKPGITVDEILVRVIAGSVNPVDWTRTGYARWIPAHGDKMLPREANSGSRGGQCFPTLGSARKYPRRQSVPAVRRFAENISHVMPCEPAEGSRAREYSRHFVGCRSADIYIRESVAGRTRGGGTYLSSFIAMFRSNRWERWGVEMVFPSDLTSRARSSPGSKMGGKHDTLRLGCAARSSV